MKISPVNLLIKPYTINSQITSTNDKDSALTQRSQSSKYQLIPIYNDYFLTFGARVDKGLDRFYEANKERTPQTVQNYIESLKDRTKYSPLEAQQNSFEILQLADTADDIKEVYPEFKTLINPEESNARRGIIKAINDYSEILAEDGKGVLKNKENFTIYLVKKIFLENKTIEEINKDLETDLEPEFKAAFLFHNEDAKFVYPTTLSSLGIEAPSSDYRQSLRYTREGYSDIVGQKISDGQRAFWASMPDTERTARARKSVEKFETWWANLPHNEKLEMIAEQDSLLAMLQDFKKEKKKEVKSPSIEGTQKAEKEGTRVHVRTGSKKLSQDELFIKWATNNLKIFNESLSDSDKETLHIKRMHNLSSRWKEMTALERTDYISKMKSGSEPLRFAMIDAWNNSLDLIKALSSHLKQNQIYKPADVLYSSQAFSQFQSDVMSEFWEKHPDFAVELGEKIQNANTRVQEAISHGTFEELKRQIIRDKNHRIKEIEAFKKLSTQPQPAPQEDYLKEFKQAYLNEPHAGAQMKNMPQAYVDDYFTAIGEGYSKECIEAWTRNLKGEKALTGDLELLYHISHSEPAQTQRMNRAIEAALGNVLYDCTHNPDVFRFSHSDAKTALAQIARGEKEINIGSQKEQQVFKMPVLKHKFDKNKIGQLYQTYKESLSENEIYRIATSFFETKNSSVLEPLQAYMDSFGKSLDIIFSARSIFPKLVKERMYKKFMDNMPSELSEKVICYFDNTSDPFGREDIIKRINFKLSKRFDFVPSIMLERYQDEIGRSIRRRSSNNIELLETKLGTKRKDPKSMAGIAILPKSDFKPINKLKVLAAEQVLAEALYDSTKNPEVFALQFEELCDNIEVFNMVRKFPSESRIYPASDFSESIVLTANKKLDLKQLTEEFIACTNDVTDNWLNTEVKNNGIGSLKTLVENLAGDETNPKILNYIAKRVRKYGILLR